MAKWIFVSIFIEVSSPPMLLVTSKKCRMPVQKCQIMQKVLDTDSKVPDSTKSAGCWFKMPDNEQEQEIYKYVLRNGFITTAKAGELLGVKHRRARAILLGMVEKAYLRKEGRHEVPFI